MVTNNARFFIQWLYWAVIYIYLYVVRRLKRRRLDLYDYDAFGDPEKMAFFVPHQEWKLELPQTKIDLQKIADSVFCFGVNSKSEYLSVRVSRRPNSSVHCSVFLQLANGKFYTLPEQNILQQQVEDPHTYGSPNFKMICILPLRKWRIFFNGLLKEASSNENEEDTKYRHVKFSFISTEASKVCDSDSSIGNISNALIICIEDKNQRKFHLSGLIIHEISSWTASSEVFDFDSDISYSALAEYVAATKGWKWPISIARWIKCNCNMYEQPGMLLGTVTVDGEKEKEIYLWGCRGHFIGQVKNIEDEHFFRIYSNAENGCLIHLGFLKFPGVISRFYSGYAMQPNGFIFPIHKCDYWETRDEGKKGMDIVCFAGERKYDLKIKKRYCKIPFYNEFDGKTFLSTADICVNGMTAKGLMIDGDIQRQTNRMKKTVFAPFASNAVATTMAFTLSFRDPFCKLIDVSGGKGSSLAKLTKMCEEIKNFTVPNGIIVTTAAYSEFIKEANLEKSLTTLENVVWSRVPGDSKADCERMVKEVTNAELPDSLTQAIQSSLKQEFGDQMNAIPFAIRSSSIGEDTEQTSAAGQMDTFLGCTGMKEILLAVKKCWASQFAFVAIEYKRRYGQLLNTPMAVAIQQMVPCDVSGVLFTCDPVTGNPEYISITANYGLGESVVSAAAEPDTIILKRDINNRLQMHSVVVGSKKIQVILDESSGITEQGQSKQRAKKCCLSEEAAFTLGNIAIKVEDNYGGPTDIEWGICGRRVFLLQARPVTSVDIETDFEIKHEFDSYLRREDEYSTTANVGEVLPGATTPLGLEVMNKLFTCAVSKQKFVKFEGETILVAPYFPTRVLHAYNHLMLCVTDSFLKFSEGEGNEISSYTKAISVSLFGRIVNDKKLLQMSKDRHGSPKKQRIKNFFRSMYIAMLMLFAGYFTRKVSKKLKKYRLPIENNSAKDILDAIAKHFHEIHIALNSHIECTFSSPLWNMAMLTLLANAKGDWDNEVYSDFAYLVSTCSEVESADVPSAMQNLAFVIAHCIEPEKFKSLDVETALQWLQSSTSEAGMKFRSFLKKHGHRCFKEFDMFSQTWKMNPKPLIKMLQEFAGKVTSDAVEKNMVPFQTVLSNLNVPLNYISKILLWLLLPHCRRGVRERELSKSVLMKAMNSNRLAYHLLAKAMVREGRLPNEEFLFFLCAEEMNLLIKTRSPRIVSKAFRRWKVHAELDKLVFPAMSTGIPKPINMDEGRVSLENSLIMTGIPVSQGVVKATARVVLNLDDATCIQPGDVLITHSTDIGWSPYFPLLSGIVTELGGLISHGAVVAREYGLPCVVNLCGATRLFKSGDKVLLDGRRGILQKLEED